jgi:hypothetical protein
MGRSRSPAASVSLDPPAHGDRQKESKHGEVETKYRTSEGVNVNRDLRARISSGYGHPGLGIKAESGEVSSRKWPYALIIRRGPPRGSEADESIPAGLLGPIEGLVRRLDHLFWA